MARNFRDLSEPKILALAITLEEEDGRIYGDFADGLRETYPASAAIFDEMQKEESDHRARLIDQFRQRVRPHDDGRRAWPHAPVSHFGLQDRDDGRGGSGRG